MKAAPTPQDKWLQGIPRGWDGIPWEWGPCLLPATGPPLGGGGGALRVPSPEVGGLRGAGARHGKGGSARDGPREDAAAASQVHLQPRSSDEGSRQRALVIRRLPQRRLSSLFPSRQGRESVSLTRDLFFFSSSPAKNTDLATPKGLGNQCHCHQALAGRTLPDRRQKRKRCHLTS